MRTSWNTDFLWICCLVLVFNIPLFYPQFIPLHDTRYIFHIGYHFYQQFFYHGNLAEWIPYGNYGSPSYQFQIHSISPAGYLIGILGSWLRIQETLFLFKLSMVVEQFLWVAGFYLLMRKLLKNRFVVLLSAMASVMSTFYMIQIYWNFRIYYLMPLVFYFLIRFFEDKKSRYMWWAGLVTLFSLVGSLPYFSVLYFYCILIFCIPCMRRRELWKSFLRWRFVDVISLILLGVCTAAYLYFVKHSMDGFHFYSEGRDENTFNSSLISFLTYGHRVLLPFKLPEYVSGMNIFNDLTLYVGVLPIFGLILACFRMREGWNSNFLILTGILIWLSFGGLFSAVAYAFPGFSIFRHLGHIHGLTRILILICGLIGLDSIASFYPQCVSQMKSVRFSRKHKLLAILVVCIAFDFAVTTSFKNYWNAGIREAFRIMLIGFLIRTVLYWQLARAGIRRLKSPTAYGHGRFLTGVMVIYFLDLLSYHVVLYKFMPRPESYSDTHALSNFKSLHRVAPITYVDKRVDYIPLKWDLDGRPIYNENQRLNLSAPEYPFQNQRYFTTYNFANIDPCFSRMKLDLFPERLHMLIKSRGGVTDMYPDARFLPPGDQNLFEAVGCNTPKLRLVTTTEVVDPHSVQAMKEADFHSKLYLHHGISEKGMASSLDNIHVLSFDSNSIEIEVDRAGSGPGYVVYADSFHAGWRATLNGSSVAVELANFAFKAVKVETPGVSKIRLWFDGGRMGCLARSVALGSAIFVLLIFGWLIFGAGSILRKPC